jgi:hypothetical protein
MAENMMLTAPCPGCPFGPDSIVSPARVRQIARDARRFDSNFICHKTTPGATRIDRLPERMTCRGFFDAVHLKDGTGQILRIAGRLGGMTEVALTPDEVANARASLVPYREQKHSSPEAPERKATTWPGKKRSQAPSDRSIPRSTRRPKAT